MKKRVSLRWKLILLSWSLAFGTALVFIVLLHLRSQVQLLDQLEKTLQSKCDEVIAVLESAALYPAIDEFLALETNYRWSPRIYFYQISDAQGRILARSENLGDAELPIPEAWEAGELGTPMIRFGTQPDPIAADGRIRLRSERVELAKAGRDPATIVIQTAGSLASLESSVGRTLRDALLVAACSLAAIFFLLWFVTTRALGPVAVMTRKASEITATNLCERLPLTGKGDELDELARVLNDMIDRLGESLQQIEQFSSGAAHQLRTPLTRMRGELDLILRSDVSEPLKNQLESIHEELERMSRLCAQLLLLSRLHDQVSAITVWDEQIDLEEVVSELLEQMTPMANEHRVELRRGATSTVRVRGSRALLVQALFNLLSNAIEYTHDEQPVTVSIGTNGDAAWLSVEDRGPGIPPEAQDNIFQPFYRVSPSSGDATENGTGMGLAIVKGIARAHGGRVELIEAPSGGSIFRLFLPRSPHHLKTTTVAPASPRESGSDSLSPAS
jgi:two-component system OmpR family sensor kinase